MLKRLKTLYRLSGIEIGDETPKAKTLEALTNIFRSPQRLATVVDMRDSLEEFPKDEEHEII